MEIKCLGSGSSGNCYIINQEGITYLLDAGVDFKNINANVNLNDVEFAFISHEHEDHSLNLEKLKFRRVKTIYGKLVTSFEKTSITGDKWDKIRLYTFPLHHGETKNAGLIVQTENECLLYATDFNLCEYNLNKFNFTTIMVECNYDEDLIKKYPMDFKHLRQINTHMGVKGLKTFLEKTINMNSVKEVILIHLSTEISELERSILIDKAKHYLKKKKIGVCKQQGGIEWYGG